VLLLDNRLEILAVGLDLDGTLLDSEEVNVSATLETLRHFHVPEPIGGFNTKTLVGATNNQVFTAILESIGNKALFGLVGKMSAFKRQRFRECIGDTVPVSGAVKFVRVLGLKSLPRALVTSAGNLSMSIALERLGLAREEFEVLLPSDALAQGILPKPDLGQWKEASRLLGRAEEPKSVLAVEDSPKGVSSAHGAGLTVCGIMTTHSEDELLNSGASFVVRSFAELAERLSITL